MHQQQIARGFQIFSLQTCSPQGPKALRLVWWVASLSFITTLFVPHVGEEAVYTISSLEMWCDRNWLHPTLFGTPYPGRPPLFQWLIILFGWCFGMEHALIGARLIAGLATAAMAGMLLWAAWQITPQKRFIYVASLIFLSGDVLFRRSWLAYADPLFAAWTFAAMLCLWIACQRQQERWLLGAVFALSLAFLSKNHLAYVFYGVWGGVLLFTRQRKVLLSPFSWICHGLALGVPWMWASLSSEYSTQSSHLDNFFYNVGASLQWNGWSAYFFKLISFPVDVGLRLLPVSGVVAWFWFKNRRQLYVKWPAAVHPIAWMIVLNALPYWGAPQSISIRYLLPLMPWISLLLACCLWNLDSRGVRVAIAWLTVGVILRLGVGAFWYPYEHGVLRGNARVLANEVLEHVGSRPLYFFDHSARGLRLAWELDALRWPLPPVREISGSWSGYAIHRQMLPGVERAIQHYPFGRVGFFLMCQGMDCPSVR